LPLTVSPRERAAHAPHEQDPSQTYAWLDGIEGAAVPLPRGFAGVALEAASTRLAIRRYREEEAVQALFDHWRALTGAVTTP
jgi:hypothetical protein